MICFKDMTFCRDPKCTCDRKLTNEVRKAAKKWWGSDDAPIAVRDKCNCEPDGGK
jgi:hypothetical protein